MDQAATTDLCELNNEDWISSKELFLNRSISPISWELFFSTSYGGWVARREVTAFKNHYIKWRVWKLYDYIGQEDPAQESSQRAVLRQGWAEGLGNWGSRNLGFASKGHRSWLPRACTGWSCVLEEETVWKRSNLQESFKSFQSLVEWRWFLLPHLTFRRWSDVP